MPEIKPEIETSAKIKVVGVGGSGGSAINRMINAKIRGVDFIAMNTDVQALHTSLAPRKIQLGPSISRGLGAGMNPEVGARAAEESQSEIREALKGSDMVFITCGLGGGSGSGASPKVAEIAREMGILTVAVVTKPFQFEGHQRKVIADQAFEKLVQFVDTIITIPNDRILQIIDRKTSMMDAFEIVDDVLRQGVQGISEIISVPGLINVDFADARSIMENRGSALMGIGRGHGENRAVDAAKAAIASPLLEVSIDGAKGILFTVTGGSNLGMYEVTEAAKVITESADPQAKIIFGAIIDETLKDEIKVTVIATGFDERTMPRATKTVIAGGAYNPAHGEQRADKFSFRKPAPEAYEAPRQAVTQAEKPVAQPAAHQPHVQPPSYAPTHTAPPAQTALSRVPNNTPNSSAASEDDTVEIPALFRKKMM
jgi:cell division protein FtsZ